jgi:hypothetical protein
LVRKIEGVARLAAAVGLDGIAEIDRRGLAGEHGCIGTAALLRQLLRLSPGEAVQRVQLATALTATTGLAGDITPAALPATAEALRVGDIHSDHARLIQRTLQALPSDVPAQDRVEAEAFLAHHARELDPTQLRVLAARVRAYLDQDGTLREERDAVQQRELYFGRDRHGRTTFKGRLDCEAGAALRSAIEALAKPRPAGQGTPDTRSPQRRRADALVDIVTATLNDGTLPTQGGQRPHVTVTIDFHRLLAGVDTGIVDWGGPISAHAVRRIACDCTVLPVVLGSAGQPLDVGRSTYTVPRSLRRALIARDSGCAWPGCDRPPQWCEAHHILAWTHGGTTALHNLVMLCGFHHDHAHDPKAGWTIRINPHGRPEFLPPTWIDPTRTPRHNTTPHDLNRLRH